MNTLTRSQKKLLRQQQRQFRLEMFKARDEGRLECSDTTVKRFAGKAKHSKGEGKRYGKV